jgi:hypothetical protein
MWLVPSVVQEMLQVMSVAAATAMRARIIMFFMLIAREIEIVRRKVRFSAVTAAFEKLRR